MLSVNLTAFKKEDDMHFFIRYSLNKDTSVRAYNKNDVDSMILEMKVNTLDSPIEHILLSSRPASAMEKELSPAYLSEFGRRMLKYFPKVTILYDTTQAQDLLQ